MSSESFNPQIEAESTAPDTADTAPANVVDNNMPEEQEQPEPKTFTQEELDAKVGERLAKERRKWERQQSTPAPQPQTANPPDPATFKTLEEYTDALADFKADQKIAQRESVTTQSRIETEFNARADKAREKYSDYQAVVHSPDLQITPTMAATIYHSDIGPDVAYYLGQNPDEAERISELSPLLQAKEMGKIEAKVIANPPAKKTSSAPNPINPVSGGHSANPSRDTQDPRSIKAMSDSEWIRAENARRLKQANNK
jgi:hypothetical protein